MPPKVRDKELKLAKFADIPLAQASHIAALQCSVHPKKFHCPSLAWRSTTTGFLFSPTGMQDKFLWCREQSRFCLASDRQTWLFFIFFTLMKQSLAFQEKKQFLSSCFCFWSSTEEKGYLGISARPGLFTSILAKSSMPLQLDQETVHYSRSASPSSDIRRFGERPELLYGSAPVFNSKEIVQEVPEAT